MKKRLLFHSLFAFGIALSSCVRDEILPCPPLQINLDVTDKNYFNIDEIPGESRISENLPFKEYVSVLSYQLRDASNGVVIVRKGPFRVDGNEQLYPIAFSDTLPHGTYVLTVWGGHETTLPLTADADSLCLHPDGYPNDDIYLTNDTLLYDATNYAYTAGLERTKGKLLVQVEKLMQGVSRVEQRVTRIWTHVDRHFEYSRPDTVRQEHPMESGAGDDVLLRTCLAPSAMKENSKHQLRFYKGSQLVSSDKAACWVPLTLNRNEITLIKYICPTDDYPRIFLWVNDNWELIHQMEID